LSRSLGYLHLEAGIFLYKGTLLPPSQRQPTHPNFTPNMRSLSLITSLLALGVPLAGAAPSNSGDPNPTRTKQVRTKSILFGAYSFFLLAFPSCCFFFFFHPFHFYFFFFFFFFFWSSHAHCIFLDYPRQYKIPTLAQLEKRGGTSLNLTNIQGDILWVVFDKVSIGCL
jgi:hypothetical protein